MRTATQVVRRDGFESAISPVEATNVHRFALEWDVVCFCGKLETFVWNPLASQR